MEQQTTTLADTVWPQLPTVTGRAVASVLSLLMSAGVLAWGIFFSGG